MKMNCGVWLSWTWTTYQTLLWVQAAQAGLQSQDEEQNRGHEA